mgnify:CR=1 FL=1
MEVLTPLGVGAESLEMEVAAYASLIVLVERSLRAQLLVSVRETAVHPPLTNAVNLEIFTDFCLIFRT